MALTSDKLKEMTRRKLGLVKEIDKNPADETIRDELAAVECEIKSERTKIIADDAKPTAPDPAVAPISARENQPSQAKAGGKKEATKDSAARKACGSKKLSDFF